MRKPATEYVVDERAEGDLRVLGTRVSLYRWSFPLSQVLELPCSSLMSLESYLTCVILNFHKGNNFVILKRSRPSHRTLRGLWPTHTTYPHSECFQNTTSLVNRRPRKEAIVVWRPSRVIIEGIKYKLHVISLPQSQPSPCPLT